MKPWAESEFLDDLAPLGGPSCLDAASSHSKYTMCRPAAGGPPSIFTRRRSLRTFLLAHREGPHLDEPMQASPISELGPSVFSKALRALHSLHRFQTSDRLELLMGSRDVPIGIARYPAVRICLLKARARQQCRKRL